MRCLCYLFSSFSPDTTSCISILFDTQLRIVYNILHKNEFLSFIHDISLGDLIEGIVLHSFYRKVPFSDKSLKKIEELKKVYNLELIWEDSY